eukprot:PhM_4_TR2437/c1_g1_i1/m.50802
MSTDDEPIDLLAQPQQHQQTINDNNNNNNNNNDNDQRDRVLNTIWENNNNNNNSAVVDNNDTNDTLRARLCALQTECAELRTGLTRAAAERDALLSEGQTQTKLIQSLTRKLEAERTQSQQLASKQQLLETQISVLKKELSVNMRAGAKQDKTAQQTDGQLQKVLEALEPPRTPGSVATTTTTTTAPAPATADAAAAENRRLQQQRTDLLHVIKKQAKLIDILKRQKMHVEATKVLQLAEEDFLRTLEVGL